MDTQLVLTAALVASTDDLSTLDVLTLEALYEDAEFKTEQSWRAQSELTACEGVGLDLAQFAIAQAEAAEARRREIYAVLQTKYYPQPVILFDEHDPLAEKIRTESGTDLLDEMDVIDIEDAPVDYSPLGGW